MTFADIASELRPLQPGELPAANEQVARWMDFESLGTMCETFPQVYRNVQGDRTQRWGAWCEDHLCSHVATRRVTLSTHQGLIEVQLVGSVATSPRYRGRGLATTLLKDVIRRARNDGLDAILLWSNLWSFYQKLGFRPAGQQIEFALEQPVDAQRDPGVRWAYAGDVADMWELHERKPLRVRRSMADMALLLSAGQMQTLVLEEGGVVRAYACLGKGQDFRRWWHELGGEDVAVRRLLESAMVELNLPAATVVVPRYRPKLFADTNPGRGACALRLALTDAGQAEFFVDGLDSI